MTYLEAALTACAARPAPARRAALATTVLFVAVIAAGAAECFVVNAPGAIGAMTSAAARLKIDPNTASAADLQLLPGVGPALAAEIIEYRQRAAPRRAYAFAHDLDAVPGIGPLTLREMRPFLALEVAAGRP